MFNPLTVISISTNLRTVLLTMPTCLLLYANPATSSTVTGTMALSAFDLITSPASHLPDTAWTFAVHPAPFGIAALSSAGIALPTHFGTFAIGGITSSRWTDLWMKGAEQWRVTSAYRVGLTASLHWARASSFPSIWTGDAAIHAAADLDSVWTVGLALDHLFAFNSGIDPADDSAAIFHRSLRLGLALRTAVVAALDVVATPGSTSYLVLSALLEISPEITVRLLLRSDPIMPSISIRCHLLPSLPMVLSADYVQLVGLRTSVIVEIP